MSRTTGSWGIVLAQDEKSGQDTFHYLPPDRYEAACGQYRKSQMTLTLGSPEQENKCERCAQFFANRPIGI